MEKITGNEPATGYGFANEAAHQEVPGLTIRQHFAAMAMQGLLANNIYHNPNEKNKMITVPNLAIAAVHYADALIAELNKPNPSQP